MHPSLEEICDFIQTETGTRKIVTKDTRLVEDLGCVGDDFFELLEKYSRLFHVNLDSFLWYFHTPDEGSLFNFGALFFKPIYKRVQRIPVTVGMLKDFADSGVWNIAYPPHTLPSLRFDMLFMQTFWGVILLLILSAIVLTKCGYV